MSSWVKDPHSGGVKIPPAVQERVKQRILDYAAANYAGKYTRLGIRFRSQFCYIDAYTEPDVPLDFPSKELRISREEYLERRRNTPLHLCRLRYFSDEEAWLWGFTPIAVKNTSLVCSEMAVSTVRLKKPLISLLCTCNNPK